MAVAGKQSWLYINTAADCLVGNGIKQGGTFGQCDLSTANTEIPLGIATETAKLAPAAGGPFNAVTVETRSGAQVKMIAGAAVAINVLLTATAAGKFITAAKSVTPAAAEYVWGRSIEAAATGNNDVISGIFNWYEMDIT